MPIVSAPAKVLVTGANGFIAVWIIRYLLEQGYAVRGTVRNTWKGGYLNRLFKTHGSKFEYIVVDDITKDGAFDDAVTGVDAVLHTAAAVSFTGTPDTVIPPALRGTETVLKSIGQHGPSVRRVILTSSVVTLLEPQKVRYLYTESDWNEFAVLLVEEKKDQAPGPVIYTAAKVLQEKLAWDFVAKHKEEIKWDLVAILPPRVFGPILQEGLNPSGSSFLYDNLQVEKPADQLGIVAGNWVDVRDIALAHVLALQKEKAGGERLITSAGPYTWQDVYDALAAAGVTGVPRGNPDVERKPFSRADSSKAVGILGVTFRSLEESATDTILSLRERLAEK